MGVIDEFVRLQKVQGKAYVKPQLVWAKVKSVNWENKTMVATDIIDGLEYYDVLLGLGAVQQKPKVGTKCLLGILGNQASATFLVEAEAVEEIICKSDKTKFVIKETGFIIQQNEESLKSVLNDFIDEVNKIVVIYGNTINKAKVTAIKKRLNTILVE
ncbi:hypothetical protein MC378_10450 [Polaribacter sp. MSW13]|uniref:Uncharacterized protein n=1 Tax=Polaribacter marinus TaxID=2916838 RepID=A0A9X2AKJ5_9FLAO|nr:hypothetical protein [Polaribacter marinus]MCI2229588.1 hypothetical protein [Polaribacter marinus]